MNILSADGYTITFSPPIKLPKVTYDVFIKEITFNPGSEDALFIVVYKGPYSRGDDFETWCMSHDYYNINRTNENSSAPGVIELWGNRHKLADAEEVPPPEKPEPLSYDYTTEAEY